MPDFAPASSKAITRKGTPTGPSSKTATARSDGKSTQFSLLRVLGICFVAAWVVVLFYFGTKMETVGAFTRVIKRIRRATKVNASAVVNAAASFMSPRLKDAPPDFVEKDVQPLLPPSDNPQLVAPAIPRRTLRTASSKRGTRQARRVVVVELPEESDGSARDAAPAAPLTPARSTVTCSMWGTFTEACHYTDVCFDPISRTLLLTGDEESVRATGWRPNT